MLIVTYVIQLTLYFVGTITYNVSANALLGSPQGAATPGLGAFLSSMNVTIQAGLAVEGLVILAVVFAQAFRVRGDTTRI